MFETLKNHSVNYVVIITYLMAKLLTIKEDIFKPMNIIPLIQKNFIY